MSEIINKVANSPLVTIDLENFYRPEERMVFDLKDYLFQELVLREKDFRLALKDLDWEAYRGKLVAIDCSVDAIVPNWAFMLVGIQLTKIGVEYVIGDLKSLEQFLFEEAISKINPVDFKDKPVVIKGCSKFPVPMYAYGRIVAKIQGHAKSIMYGEPCSTVPLYKVAK
ncbi:hypothetical protein P872_23375 [Rhodonellum psychrophilum GCM71 = DSM 17998]|uniref:DUF2480 family protein n=2 Tax=Rhodonellum TaxID=336827 RepID=U5C4N3_9BACT|nr:MULTISPECIES: DUF2480 family protein [Rhodonellum]ERM85003.1 hypothetical protein P872_23375 [Rhodonellum psychrophilum GCM71 = DSM 17998]MDO9551932.1 DUF2480 family protein [Rhodonellum sp.]SDY76017.1 Protein of unknown function [Rhodonellum ikkaensis]